MAKTPTATDDENKIPTRDVFRFLLVAFLLPLIIFPLAGDWGWPQAWALYGMHLAATFAGRGLAWKSHPDLLAERSKLAEFQDALPGEKKLVLWMGVLLPLTVWVVAALEHRFVHPALIAPGATLVGAVGVLAGYLFSNWAFVVNRYFSAVVRLQPERGQTVISHGPYAWVRHPGYAGGLLVMLAYPMLLSSLFGLIPALVYLAMAIMRTLREDRFLRQNLEGYQGYAEKVKYRLLPWVW